MVLLPVISAGTQEALIVEHLWEVWGHEDGAGGGGPLPGGENSLYARMPVCD